MYYITGCTGMYGHSMNVGLQHRVLYHCRAHGRRSETASAAWRYAPARETVHPKCMGMFVQASRTTSNTGS